jgi:uncharacterized protein
MARILTSSAAVLLAVVSLVAAPSREALAQEARLVRIATGSPAGVYFPVGIALCRLVNENRPEHGIRCSAEPSAGSVENLAALRAEEVDLAIVQSDTQAEAVDATGETAFESLRSVMSLHSEPVTVVARADAAIADFAGLTGKRVSVGPAGSGQRQMWNVLMQAQNWTADDFSPLLDLSSTAQASALCDGQLDAFVATIGHPALTVQEATLSCDARLVPVEGAAVDRLVGRNPAFARTIIPGGLYRGNRSDIPSFGVSATVVTRADVPDDIIYTFVQTALGNIDRLRGFDPALAQLDPAAMATTGLTAPMHPGARQAFEAAGAPPAN